MYPGSWRNVIKTSEICPRGHVGAHPAGAALSTTTLPLHPLLTLNSPPLTLTSPCLSLFTPRPPIPRRCSTTPSILRRHHESKTGTASRLLGESGPQVAEGQRLGCLPALCYCRQGLTENIQKSSVSPASFIDHRQFRIISSSRLASPQLGHFRFRSPRVYLERWSLKSRSSPNLHTLVHPGYSPFFMSGPTLNGSKRLESWTRDHNL